MILSKRDTKNKAKLLASLEKEKARLDKQLKELLTEESLITDRVRIHKESLHDVNKYIQMLSMME